MLQNAYLKIQKGGSPKAFSVDVGVNNSCCGTLSGRVIEEDDRYSVAFGYTNKITHSQGVEQVFHALDKHADLVTIYFESGHVYSDGTLAHRPARVAPFPVSHWKFNDFTGYDITQEKPKKKVPQEIHDQIGEPGDTSLFGWVSRNFNDGWLTCDDGSYEIADFLHCAPDGTLSLVHVKGANNSSTNREISTGSFEQLVSQAKKNLIFMNTDRLLSSLRKPQVSTPATWTEGKRVGTRDEMLEMLSARSGRDLVKIVIIQPHVSKAVHQQATESSGNDSRQKLQMQRLETLLNSARSVAVGAGADFYVIGSLQ